MLVTVAAQMVGVAKTTTSVHLAGVLVNEVRDPGAHECWAAYEAVTEEVLKSARR